MECEVYLVCRRPKLSLPSLPAGVGRARGRRVCGMPAGPRAIAMSALCLFSQHRRLSSQKIIKRRWTQPRDSSEHSSRNFTYSVFANFRSYVKISEDPTIGFSPNQPCSARAADPTWGDGQPWARRSRGHVPCGTDPIQCSSAQEIFSNTKQL